MKLLKAVDAALTAFVQELWPVPPAVFSDEWFESSSAPVAPPVGVADESPGSCEHSRAPEPGQPDLSRNCAKMAAFGLQEWMAGQDCINPQSWEPFVAALFEYAGPAGRTT